jgi:hypothetical protein
VIIWINVAKCVPKGKKKLRTKMNGKFDYISGADENK